MTGPTVDAHRQAECLRHIANAIKSWDEAPTLSELGSRMGIDKVSVHLLVKKLRADGLIVTSGSGWRNLRITATGQAIVDGVIKGYHTVAALQARRPL